MGGVAAPVKSPDIEERADPYEYASQKLCFSTLQLRHNLDLVGFGTILGKVGGGRKRRGPRNKSSGSEPYGSGGPEEAAAFIAETSGGLSKIAQRHGLETLRHLLDMTQLEAAEWLRNRRRLS